MRAWPRHSHAQWSCRSHVVIVPTYRQHAICGQLRQARGPILRELCDQCGIALIAGHAMPDQVHMCWSIPPKESVSHALGRLQGQAAMRLPRDALGRKRHVTGYHFWSRGCGVRTVGWDEEMLRTYLRNQEEAAKRADDQLHLDENISGNHLAWRRVYEVW